VWTGRLGRPGYGRPDAPERQGPRVLLPGNTAIRHRYEGSHGVRKSFKDVLTEYGTIGLLVYLTIFVVVLFGAWLAIRFGWQSQSVAANMGTVAAAYVVTKVAQPARIASTVLLTPIVARLYRRFLPPRPE
jgi:hypothetical protein